MTRSARILANPGWWAARPARKKAAPDAELKLAQDSEVARLADKVLANA